MSREPGVRSRRSGDGNQVTGAGGFSLIEVIITLVVLAIAAAGVITVFVSGGPGTAEPLILSQASRLVQEKMDIIAADRREPGRGFTYVSRTPVDNYPDELVTLGGHAYARIIRVVCVDAADLNADPGPGCPQSYKRVTVTVSWNAGADSVSVTTLFADYGPY